MVCTRTQSSSGTADHAGPPSRETDRPRPRRRRRRTPRRRRTSAPRSPKRRRKRKRPQRGGGRRSRGRGRGGGCERRPQRGGRNGGLSIIYLGALAGTLEATSGAREKYRRHRGGTPADRRPAARRPPALLPPAPPEYKSTRRLIPDKAACVSCSRDVPPSRAFPRSHLPYAVDPPPPPPPPSHPRNCSCPISALHSPVPSSFALLLP